MPLLLGHDDAICGWAVAKLGHSFMPPASVVGWVSGEGRIKSAALFFGMYEGGNIDMGLAIDPPMSKGFVIAISRYVFQQLQCSRVTVRPPKSNSGAIEQLKRAGFKTEATLKHYYGNEDAEQLRLLAADCKWVPHVST